MNKVLVVLGILLFVVAGAAMFYTQTATVENQGFFGIGATSASVQTAPYAPMVPYLGGAGLLFLIVGLAVKS